MQCIKCGCTIPDGELFCANCASGPVLTKVSPAERPVQKKAAVKQTKQTVRPHRSRGLIVTVVILVLLLAASFGYIGYDLVSYNAKKTSLVVREADLTLRENEQDQLEQSLKDTKSALDAANATVDSLQKQIDDLNSQMAGSESTFYQSQYDQQMEMTQLATENEALYDMVEELETENQSLTDQLTVAKDQSALYREKANFLDTYAVFVENDGTSYYHAYNCPNFKKKSFWVYSRKLAENYGYTACPNCGG